MDLLLSLERRAREKPEAPWFFFRRGLDWRWRSHARVADQVARSAAELALISPAQAIGCRPRQDPDALAALFAALSSACAIDPERESIDAPWLAECRGPLEHFTAMALSAESSGAPEGEAARRFILSLSRDVEHLSALLRTPLRGLHQRPILYAGAATPPTLLPALAGWSLEQHAAWALEEQADAFAATAYWTRPHVLIASLDELESLTPHFDKAARRRSRLRAIIMIDPAPAGAEELGGASKKACEEEFGAELEERLGCAILKWSS